MSAPQSIQSDGAATPIGLTQNLFAVGHTQPGATSTLRPPRRRPSVARLNRGYPLAGFGSLSEYHQYVTAICRCFASATDTRPFQGLLPFSVFPAAKSHLPPVDPNQPVTLRPRDFSPPRRFAPFVTCRAYSIPVPLLGFTLRGFAPSTVPYALSSAVPLRAFTLVWPNKSLPSRSSHTVKRSVPGLATNQVAGADYLLGLFHFEVFSH